MTLEKNYFRRLADVVFDFDAPRAAGRVIDLRGGLGINSGTESGTIQGLACPLGARVAIERSRGGSVQAEVVGTQGALSAVEFLDPPGAVLSGARAHFCWAVPVIGASRKFLGRAIDALGRPTDGLGPVSGRSPVALAEPGAFAAPLSRAPLESGVNELAGETQVFRGARVAVSERGSSALADLALAHDGPVVAALVGGTPGAHASFRRALGEARPRTACVLEPGSPSSIRARTAYRVAEALARFLAAEEGRDAILLVDWRAGIPAPVAEIAPVEEVTSFWWGVEFGASFDAEFAPRPERTVS